MIIEAHEYQLWSLKPKEAGFHRREGSRIPPLKHPTFEPYRNHLSGTVNRHPLSHLTLHSERR